MLHFICLKKLKGVTCWICRICTCATFRVKQSSDLWGPFNQIPVPSNGTRLKNPQKFLWFFGTDTVSMFKILLAVFGGQNPCSELLIFLIILVVILVYCSSLSHQHQYCSTSIQLYMNKIFDAIKFEWYC
jgi:hypothetical protein